MALTNIEGCTIGGLDEGRGHNTRILAARMSVVLGTNVTGTCVSSVTKDGVVTNTHAGSATHAMTVQHGSGFTFEIPAVPDDTAKIFQLTFGQVSTTAPTPYTTHMNIVGATVNCLLTDANGIVQPIPCSIGTISGDQVQIDLGEATLNATDIVIAAGDTLAFNVIAFAQPA